MISSHAPINYQIKFLLLFIRKSNVRGIGLSKDFSIQVYLCPVSRRPIMTAETILTRAPGGAKTVTVRAGPG